MHSLGFTDRRDVAHYDATRGTGKRPLYATPDDVAMLRAAAELTRDLGTPSARIYWTDMLLSAGLGYAALLAAMMIASPLAATGAGLVAVLALYRASLFIHELSHMKERDLPRFRIGWNLLVGIPLLLPSFMYEGVHTLHHARTRYGTAEDPEYLPLARMKPWTLPLFVVTALLAPVALLVRFAVLTPLGLVAPRLRRHSVAAYSALAINPAFRRRPPEGVLAGRWRWQEALASVWAITLLAMVAAGLVPLRAFLVALAVLSGIALINQVRTLVAHLWENDGEQMTVTGQYLDSVNVPPPSLLPYLWAPVGLRYHALHHLLPSLPYHSLGTAHRRLVAELGSASTYPRASHATLSGLVLRLTKATFRA